MRHELHKVIKNQGEFERQTRKQIEEEFAARKRAAVEEADTETFEQVEAEEKKWREEAAAASTDESTEDKPVDPHYPDFAERNPWYGSDERMTRYANSMGLFVKEDRPEVVGTPEFYAEVEKLVKRQFPDKFENPRRRRSNAVEGGRGPRGASGKKGYADLPPAAKKKCDEYVERGYVKDRAEYAREYFNEEK
jgi:hypothetical protein